MSGCRIEQTPIRYIDQVETPEAVTRASVDELSDRLRSTAPSLQRDNLSDVVAALAPHPEIATIGPTPDSISGTATDLWIALGDLTTGRYVTVEDLEVDIGAGNNLAWFRTSYLLTGGDADAERVHFTGVFVREGGEWRLRQGHLGAPAPAATAPTSPAAEADTLVAAG